jgi:hypothetical protein
MTTRFSRKIDEGCQPELGKRIWITGNCPLGSTLSNPTDSSPNAFTIAGGTEMLEVRVKVTGRTIQYRDHWMTGRVRIQVEFMCNGGGNFKTGWMEY